MVQLGMGTPLLPLPWFEPATSFPAGAHQFLSGKQALPMILQSLSSPSLAKLFLTLNSTIHLKPWQG